MRNEELYQKLIQLEYAVSQLQSDPIQINLHSHPSFDGVELIANIYNSRTNTYGNTIIKMPYMNLDPIYNSLETIVSKLQSIDKEYLSNKLKSDLESLVDSINESRCNYEIQKVNSYNSD